MNAVYENPTMTRDALMRTWSVRDAGTTGKVFKDADWDVLVTFTRKPLKVGDRVAIVGGKTVGKIVAIHDGSKLAWVSGINFTPSTLRLQDLRHADDVQG